MLFVVGGPGSGKSFIIQRDYLRGSDFVLVDSDIIARHMPESLSMAEKYGVGKELATWLLKSLLDSHASVIVHATGASYDACAQWFDRAREKGYRSIIVWVRCHRDTAEKRNAGRSCPIPPEIMAERWDLCETSILRLLQHADEVRYVDND